MTIELINVVLLQQKYLRLALALAAHFVRNKTVVPPRMDTQSFWVNQFGDWHQIQPRFKKY
jgi:hypothetical protein